jgi:hypothetical protein
MTHPTEDNTCYIKMNDTLVDGKCSKFNDKLYDATFGDTVSTIQPDKINDPYVANTLTDNVCKISFNDQSSGDSKDKYAIYVDSRDPKVQNLTGSIVKTKATNDALQQQLDERIAEANQLKTVDIPNKEKVISEYDRQIQIKESEMAALNAQISTLQNADNSAASRLYDRDINRRVKICEDTNFGGRCGILSIGEYTRGVMEAHNVRNDKMSSISVPDDVSVTLYSDDQFRGNTKLINGPANVNLNTVNWDNSKNKMNDSVSSLRVKPKPIFSNFY